MPGGPTVEVLFGGDDGGPDVGLIRIEVPAGAGLPAHDHGGSDVILVPLEGEVQVTQGDDTRAVRVGDALLIRKEEKVALRNPTDQVAHLLVAAAPVAFVAAIRAWPDDDGA